MNLRWSQWKGLVFVILVMGLHWIGTRDLPLVDRDEPRFAQATREMLETGDWVVPTFNGQPRYDKPPLIYWAQAVSMRCFGPSEAAARFPSVAAAALTAVALVLWARRAAGDAAGWMAGSLFAVSLQVFVHARLAVADLMLVSWVTLSAWSLWEVARRRREGVLPGPWDWMLWISLALGFLTKGPVAWFPLLVGLVVSPRPRSLRVMQGACVVLLVVGSWGVPALMQTRGEFLVVGLGHHVVDRFAGNLEGHGSGTVVRYLLSLPFYTATIWPSFFPASIWIPFWIRSGCKGSETSLLARQCRVGFLLILGVFTLGNTKLPHYLLPALPWVTVGLAETWAVHRRPHRIWVRTVLVVAAIEVFFAMAVLWSGVEKSMTVTRSLFTDLDRWPLSTEFATTQYREPSLVWSFRGGGRAQVRFLETSESRQFLELAGPRACLLTLEEFNAWDGRQAKRTHGEPVIRAAHGWNLVHGRRVDLVLVRFER